MKALKLTPANTFPFELCTLGHGKSSDGYDVEFDNLKINLLPYQAISSTIAQRFVIDMNVCTICL